MAAAVYPGGLSCVTAAAVIRTFSQPGLRNFRAEGKMLGNIAYCERMHLESAAHSLDSADNNLIRRASQALRNSRHDMTTEITLSAVLLLFYSYHPKSATTSMQEQLHCYFCLSLYYGYHPSGKGNTVVAIASTAIIR